MRYIMMSCLFALVLASCGGGGGAGTTASSDNASATTSTPARNSSVSSGSASSNATSTVSVSSSDGSIPADAVVTFGQVFAAGVAPASVQVSLNGRALPTQVDIKRRHPDGSIRHAILSVHLPASNSALSLSVAPGQATAQDPAVSVADARSSPIDYRVEITEAGTTYVTTLKSALSSGTSPWLTGPIANEWRARVAPVAGSTPHPSLRVLFDARYYTPTQGRVSIAIENVESNAARGDRNYDLHIFDNNGNEVFGQTGITHYFQTRLRRIFQFGGAKPLVAIADAASLQNTFAIPKYTDADIGANAVTLLRADWMTRNRTLFGNGIINSAMPDTGGRKDIGPLPGWTVIALLSRDPAAYEVMFDAADRAATFSVHYRDSATEDVISIDQHPTLTTQNNGIYSDPADRLPASTLPMTSPHDADIAHQPSMDYVPYIISGDRYYLDEIYFWSDWNLISQSFPDRSNQLGLVQNEQLRGQAWALRSFGEAAWIAPDGDWEKDYFADKVKQNIAWYRANAMPTTPLGMYRGTADWNGNVLLDTNPDLSSDVAYFIAPWMHDFFAVTLARLCEMGFDAKDLRDWSLGFTVKRFTSAPDFSPMDGTAYHLAIQLTGGKVIQTMADLSYYSFFNRQVGPPTSLPFTNDPDGYGIQALAALGAAADANLPGAIDAFMFVRSEILKRGVNQSFIDNPTWNIVPRKPVTGLQDAPGIYPGLTAAASSAPPSTSSGTPVSTSPTPVVDNLPRNSDNSIQDAWFAQLPLRQWIEVPGSRLLDNIAVPPGYIASDLTAIVAAWGGAALDTKRNGLHLFGGGHGDGKWNGLLFFSFDTYRWTVTWPGTPIAQNTGAPGNFCVGTDSTNLNADGTPMACHSYYGLTYIPERDELFVARPHAALWNFATANWQKPILDEMHATSNNDVQAWAHNGKVYVFCGDKNPITGVPEDPGSDGW
ncbi:MAG TPA: hypothetical protein VFW00_04855, partial [Rhodocyclaceae bacterium]|nr:hypothetical protein [Rhodocyclaceae bacterium]